MSSVVLILEGLGDVQSYPILVGKIGAVLHQPYFASQPIKAGNAYKLEQDGWLERFVEMAAGRAEADAVVVAVDLDDGCHVEYQARFSARAAAVAARFNKPVRVAFAIREFECWFLEEIEHLRKVAPEYEWDPAFTCPNPPDVRGAKEKLNSAMKRHYKESVDQAALARKLDVKRLYSSSRSFRKFVRAVTGLDYVELTPHFAL